MICFASLCHQARCLIYSGSNPSSDFALVGSFRLAEPIQEKRAIAKLGGDVVIMTKEGYLPLIPSGQARPCWQ
jgi:hypothetical protein